MAVYALADYVRINRELSPEYTVTVDFDGRQRRTYQVNAANVLFFDNRFIVPDALIHNGALLRLLAAIAPSQLNSISLRRVLRVTSTRPRPRSRPEHPGRRCLRSRRSRQ